MRSADFETARPLPATEGIVARDGDGEAVAAWWSQRFIAVLESFGVGARLERGRRYARDGQVTELEVEPGIVLAKVQGTRYTPYRVRIRAKLLSEHQWRRAERALAAQALPLAQLLAGQMPRDIEQLLQACKLTLFPATYDDVNSSCTCPDAENPCKHIAAVYYLLAERFDADPFLIFTWRGRTEEELLSGLRARRGRSNRKPRTPPPSTPGPAAAAPAPAPADRPFWNVGPELADLRISPLAGEAPEALVRRLGPAPTAAGSLDLADVLAGMYAQLAAAAERRALAE
ncbi:MAG: SWIM zinc finger family protein [Solirubrobacteraceae bacterium MAG38_C4-C5]|nr:SWIM zinc finger family protein [Candidatus Siliceabacter maunaloa]